MTTKISAVLALGLLASVGPISAQSRAKTPATRAPSPSPTATAAPALAVDDLDTLRGHLNETVDVRGTPTGTGHSKSGTVAYLNFAPAHKAMSVVAFLNGGAGGGDPAAHKAQSEDDLKSFVGKSIIVHGKLAEYKGDLQIVLDSLDQIKVTP